MSTGVLSVASFTLVLLGALHLALWYAYKRNTHLFLALGWLTQLPYIYLEKQVEDGDLPQIVPLVAANFALVFFIASRERLRGNTRILRVTIELVLGVALTLSFLFLEPSLDHFGGSLFSSYVYISLGLRLKSSRTSNFSKLFLRPGESKLGLLLEEDYLDQLPDFMMDAEMNPTHSSAISAARRGRAYLAVSFLCFGFLQLFYPFRDPIREFDSRIWMGLFLVGMILKLLMGAGFVILLQAFQSVRELNILKSMVLEKLAVITASVLHDIGGPVGSLRNAAIALRDLAGDLHSTQASQLLKLVSSVERQQHKLEGVHELVSAMRTLPATFRDTMGKKPPAALDVIKKMAKENVEGIFRYEKVRIDEGAWRSGLTVLGDNNLLAQVFTNLLVNAVEARKESKPGSEPLVSIGSESFVKENMISFFVEDDGKGVDEEVLPFMDRPFVSTKNSSGTRNRGLGFYIVCRLIDLHGGRVSIQSWRGDGAVEIVAFPSGNRTKEEAHGIKKEGTRITVFLPGAMVPAKDRLIQGVK